MSEKSHCVSGRCEALQAGDVMTESDGQYFVRRAAEERLAAERASHKVAKAMHLDLAARYEAAASASQGVGIADTARPCPISLTQA
jgi:hypothetical protein